MRGGVRLPVAVRDAELLAVVVVCGDIVYIEPAQPVLYREAKRKKNDGGPRRPFGIMAHVSRSLNARLSATV